MLSRPEVLSKSEKQTIKLAGDLTKKLSYKGVICLYGKIGTGKTVFAKGCARALGISRAKSPTFAFIREYKNKRKELYHCDFYRINNDDEILHHSLSELLKKKNSLIVIEWAENISCALPEERIDIFFEYKAKNSRLLKINFAHDKNWIYGLYKKYFTPAHVIKHMEKVAEFAGKIASKFIQKGIFVDLKHIEELALLHDLLKPISFRDWDKNQFGQKMRIAPKALKLWTSLRKKYGTGNDVKAVSKILKSLGKPDLAKSILTQQFDAVISKKHLLKTLEEKIVYYADKRVKHSKIVSLKERLIDGRKRYFPSGKIPKSTYRIEKKIYELEKELAR